MTLKELRQGQSARIEKVDARQPGVLRLMVLGHRRRPDGNFGVRHRDFGAQTAGRLLPNLTNRYE